MQMQMKNGLPAVRVCIYHDAVTVSRKALRSSDVCGRQEQVAKRFLLALTYRIERVKMLARDDEDMSRSLRVEIIERHANIVLKNLCRRYPAIGYLAENTVPYAHIRMI